MQKHTEIMSSIPFACSFSCSVITGTVSLSRDLSKNNLGYNNKNSPSVAQAQVGTRQRGTWCGADGTQPDTKPVVRLFVVNARRRPPSAPLGAADDPSPLIGRFPRQAARTGGAYSRNGCVLFSNFLFLFLGGLRLCAFSRRARAALDGWWDTQWCIFYDCNRRIGMYLLH